MKYNINDLDTMWRTVYGEARGTPDDCKTHVALSILNRAKTIHSPYGSSVTSVCLQHKQYSCWNSKDPNYHIIQTVSELDPIAAKCKAICEAVLEEQVSDVTKGSTHYCTLKLDPYWAVGHTPAFADSVHKYYNDVR